jgi:two-component sensor histidine kinase
MHSFSAPTCWMMGMIVADLITNSVRHAFDEQGGGTIECRVSDNGSLSSPSVTPGSGRRIIEVLAHELDADLQFKSGENGSEAVLTMPFESDRRDEQVPAVTRFARQPILIPIRSYCF